MSYKKMGAAALATAALLLSGCSHHLVSGSGFEDEVIYDIDAVDEVVVSGRGTLLLSQADEPLLVIRGDDNLVHLVEVQRRGKRLVIEPQRGFSFRPAAPLVYELSLPAVETIKLSGSVDAEIDVNVEKLSIDAAGSTDVLLVGSALELELELAGSNDVEARDFMAEEVEVDAAGSNDISVQALQLLEAELSGSNDLTYAGRPELELSMSGSNSLKRLRR